MLAYADFLTGLGDTENTRALFERALAAAPDLASAISAGAGPDPAAALRKRLQLLWDRYIQARAARI